MKSKEECLDETLKALLESWKTEPRTPIPSEKLLESFGIAQKHEFYKSLIRKLVSDGYAEYKCPVPSDDNLDFYQKEILITLDGVFLLDNKGYVRIKERKAQDRRNRIGKDIMYYIYYAGLAIGLMVAISNGCSSAPNKKDNGKKSDSTYQHFKHN